MVKASEGNIGTGNGNGGSITNMTDKGNVFRGNSCGNSCLVIVVIRKEAEILAFMMIAKMEFFLSFLAVCLREGHFVFFVS